MEKNKKKGKIFWRVLECFSILHKHLLFFIPLWISHLQWSSHIHLNRYNTQHTLQHSSALHLTCTMPGMVTIYTHTHTYTQTHWATTACMLALLSAGFLYSHRNLYLFTENACFVEILFSYISWQRGEATVPLTYRSVYTWQWPGIAICTHLVVVCSILLRPAKICTLLLSYYSQTVIASVHTI